MGSILRGLFYTLVFLVLTGVSDCDQNPNPNLKAQIGINKFDLVMQYLGVASGGNGKNEYLNITQAMGRKSIFDASYMGATYIRFAATGYGPSAYESPGALRIWKDQRSHFWNQYDQLIQDFKDSGVKAVPVFVWNPTQFPSLTKEDVNLFMTDANSSAFINLKNFISEFISRYKSSGVIKFYELTNELNLTADLDTKGRCEKEFGDTRCEPLSNFSTDEMIQFSKKISDYIKSLDSRKKISSGYSIPRASAQHLRVRPEWTPGGPDWTYDSKADFQKYLSDTHKGSDIVSIHYYKEQDGSHERFGFKNAELLDYINSYVQSIGKELYVGEYGDITPPLPSPSATWSKTVLNQITKSDIAYSSPWILGFYQNQLDHINSGSIEPELTPNFISYFQSTAAYLKQWTPPNGPDSRPPSVIITWPLEYSKVQKGTRVHIAVSDDRKLSQVEIWINDRKTESLMAPPFNYTIKNDNLSEKVRVKAVAIDSSNNQSIDEIIYTNPRK